MYPKKEGGERGGCNRGCGLHRWVQCSVYQIPNAFVQSQNNETECSFILLQALLFSTEDVKCTMKVNILNESSDKKDHVAILHEMIN